MLMWDITQEEIDQFLYNPDRRSQKQGTQQDVIDYEERLKRENTYRLTQTYNCC